MEGKAFGVLWVQFEDGIKIQEQEEENITKIRSSQIG